LLILGRTSVQVQHRASARVPPGATGRAPPLARVLDQCIVVETKVQEEAQEPVILMPEDLDALEAVRALLKHADLARHAAKRQPSGAVLPNQVD
jgi:hypothetical protein